MARQIKIKIKDKEYTLEFTRSSVEAMERGGFSLDYIREKPATMLPALFAGAFQAHHRWLKPAEIEKIRASMPHKEDLYDKLADMYAATINSLFDAPEEAEDDEGNASWSAVD